MGGIIELSKAPDLLSGAVLEEYYAGAENKGFMKEVVEAAGPVGWSVEKIHIKGHTIAFYRGRDWCFTRHDHRG